ncbi:MAG: DNA-binding protein Alba [Candidatus Korarchaeum sp.]|jgi:DNA-binding protein|uniref:DNA/RNA-binding protein Alba n=1 Tax=Korarchaeum cryptofilum (strain OPF8) TaxID=374847 RepID=B1L6H8_KORCO|nr:DNA-binding protein Alba [Candidatus Korarchaeum cryptofilum]ACB08057.1 DNA-binding protein Alba [Candidatus Korarchaeum cryptofilum OPF8]MCC6028552.1 DNA-binding protein Alba [Candidatus Korarchaeum sp.]
MVAEEGIVFVGKKPAINYVMATTLQINRGVKKIVLKARGRSISRAVDVAEITRLKYFPGKLKITDLRTGTEEIIDENGSRRDISVIEIEMTQV